MIIFLFWGVNVEMHFYVVRTPDGLYHIQNVVMGHLGQHHIHSEKSYKKWVKGIDKKFVHFREGECNCGLKPGDVKEYDGQVWHNPKWE
jgi:hypothetical protein